MTELLTFPAGYFIAFLAITAGISLGTVLYRFIDKWVSAPLERWLLAKWTRRGR